MSEILAPFLNESFHSAVQKCCTHANWPIARMEEGIVVLKLTQLNPDNPQIIYIEDYSTNEDHSLDNHIKFSLGTIFEYDEGVAPPYEILNELLQNNDIENDVGYWCIEYRRGKAAVALKHFENKKDMTVTQFQKVVIYLMMRCDLFESEYIDDN